MNTLKCFGMTSSSQTLWIGLFGMLSSYTARGAKPMLRKNHTHAIRGFPHILLATMSLSRPVGGSSRVRVIARNSDIFQEISRRQKIKYDRIEPSTSRNQLKCTLIDANQLPSFFFFSHCIAVTWI
jgi:hypothetical protein